MRYLVELIKDKNPQADIEYTVLFLMKEGYLSYTVQYHYDIYEFYQKAIEHYKTLSLPKKCAFIDTLQHFKIKKSQLYNILKEHSN